MASTMRVATRTMATRNAAMARSVGAKRRRCAIGRKVLHATAKAQGLDMRDAIEKLLRREDLALEETRDVLTVRGIHSQGSRSTQENNRRTCVWLTDRNVHVQAILDNADAAQIAAFLVLLRAKGETADEIAGLALGMKARAIAVDAGDDVLDIVGTGGDGAGTVNISTGSTVLAAAAGAKVAKHGSRSVSSLCGSADVLEKLGVAIDLGPEGVARCVKETGVGFMFAPRYHPGMATVGPVRKSLRVRTAFNILGPMLNPASASYGLIGVYSNSLAPLMADAITRLGTKKALVVHSMGLDELTPCGPADVLEVSGSTTKKYTIDPQRDCGIPKCTLEDLKGGDADLNAKILRDVFAGEEGAVADALCLNAGFALAACGEASTPQEGVAMAREVQRSGKALKTLDSWVALSQECKKNE